jgi:hypothetical protein
MHIGRDKIKTAKDNCLPATVVKGATIAFACALLSSTSVYAQSLPTELDVEAGAVNTDQSATNINQLTELDRNQQNRATGSVDETRSLINADDGAAPGIRLGTLTLRPTLQNQVIYESEKTATGKSTRTFNQTNFGATLESDWSRHSLNVTGSAVLQKNIRGTIEEDPSVDLTGDFEFNINDLLTANWISSHNFSKENRNDPNAVTNATSQANIHTFSSSLGLTKELGILRGSVTGSLTRVLNGDATLPGNIIVSGDDRDRLNLGLALRLQYAGNPVLMPFIEGEIGTTNYDQNIDNSGTNREFSSYGLRTGVAADLGDKLTGEASIGYSVNRFKDASLPNINAVTFDGELNWSPRRGTTATLALATSVEPSTTAGQSGSILYASTLDLNQEITNRLNATIGFDYSVRDFRGSTAISNEKVYGTSLAFDWAINRYLSMNSDLSFTRTDRFGSADDVDDTSIGIGLTLTR